VPTLDLMLEYVVLGAITLVTLAYLLYAMIRPERF
jgi:K+-transporting ATPase KdpF subunit